MIVILDIRSLGYYNIHQGCHTQRQSKYYPFESLHNTFEENKNFKNKLQGKKV